MMMMMSEWSTAPAKEYSSTPFREIGVLTTSRQQVGRASELLSFANVKMS